MAEITNNTNYVFCGNCGSKMNADAKFCPECGKPAPAGSEKVRCSKCGLEIAQGKKFCPACGTSTSAKSDEVKEKKEAPEAVSVIVAPAADSGSSEAGTESRRKIKPMAIIGIFAVIIIALMGVVIFSSNPENKYEDAIKFKDTGNYAKAYTLFTELGDYQDSRTQLNGTLLLWTAEVLGSSDSNDVEEFCRTVDFTQAQCEMIYSTVDLYISGHSDSENWFGYSGATQSTQNTIRILNMLPASYGNTETFLDILNAFSSSGNYEELFDEYTYLFKENWSMDLVQGLITNDDAFTRFMEGRWETWDGEYYIEFYESDNGSISTRYNLPWISEPSGTKYYDIEDLIYYYDDDEKHLAEVYEFTIEDYNTVKVFCYKNNRTYTVYR